MSSSEKFCLRWNDFESNISVAFRDIREEKDFFDVTLSVGDKQIQAHKLILSACSPFFRNVLRKNPHQHPLLYLKGVNYTDLQAVLNFMYHGEVNVAQEELNSFLAIAEELRVKGLTQNNGSEAPSHHQTQSESLGGGGAGGGAASKHSSRSGGHNKDSDGGGPPSKKARTSLPVSTTTTTTTSSSVPAYDDDDIQEVMPVKTEPVTVAVDSGGGGAAGGGVVAGGGGRRDYVEEGGAVSSHDNTGTVAQMEESYGDDGYDYSGYEEGDGGEYGVEGSLLEGGDQTKDEEEIVDPLEDLQSFVVMNGPNNFGCRLCGRTFGREKHVRRHVRNVHALSDEPQPCPTCQKIYKNDDSLKAHQRAAHGIYQSDGRR